MAQRETTGVLAGHIADGRGHVTDLTCCTEYQLCRDCDHFVEPNDAEGDGLAAYVHLCDAEADNPASDPDGHHEAVPSGLTGTLAFWRSSRPDLFVDHGDGHIGPNSEQHVMQPRRHPGVLACPPNLSRSTCRECGRVFDLTDENDAAEWTGGHDCEVS